MSNIDEQFVEFIVKSLVGKPDAVQIDRRVDEKGVLLELTVDPEDLGRIIGKRGATAQSLRTLLRALGTKNDARYNLKIVDNGPEGYERPARQERSDEESAPTEQRTNVDDDDENAEDEIAESNTATQEPAAEAEPEDDMQDEGPSELAKKHRQDLEDLDDLDI
jgi:predicted RNA-binding protein YlqC (UPF0109 family)